MKKFLTILIVTAGLFFALNAYGPAGLEHAATTVATQAPIASGKIKISPELATTIAAGSMILGLLFFLRRIKFI